MKIEMAIETEAGVFDITELVSRISFTDKLNDGCSKLEFTCVNNSPALTNGTIVRFIYDNLKFYGVVFKLGWNTKGEVSVTAYDQLRYAKAKDTIISKGETISSHAKKMCRRLGLTVGELADTQYMLATEPKDDKTWLDIIYEDILETLQNKGKWYMLRDEYGKVCVRDLENYRLNLILGDESLCYDYSYEKSIDDTTYNAIKLVSDNESTGRREVYIAEDNRAIVKYGVLQYFEVLDKNISTAKMKSKADMLLKLYSREYETLSMDCLGDTNIRAGCSIRGMIGDIGLNGWLIVQSVTHDFLPVYKMSIEVRI
ncbi:hypothetical protein HNQ56_004425 [Anaerotaenia torta]|uniref:XkdQ/YqbQ family protein n=1 Tax=Anaerotaenia torta TaxID=433293 RepID=UPI003D209294